MLNKYWMKCLLNITSLIFVLALISQNVYCIQNFALNKLAYQSSTVLYNGFQWTADKAVDGNTNGSDPEKSRTCSATAISLGNHTWEVDIGFQIMVKTITVYGRTDIGDQLSGFQVFVGNNSNPWTSYPPLVKQQSSNHTHVFAPINSVSRFVSVVRWNQHIMTLCEVMVEGECLDGVFFGFCNLTCGKCNERRSCDKDTGACPTGCDRGWKGTRCDMRCENGTYDSGCQEICGHCINGNSSCSTIDGHCKDGCQEGWQGERCKIGCENGTYGPGCKGICGNCLNGSKSCSTKDGTCMDGCLNGWQGETCKIELRDTTFIGVNAAAIGGVVGAVIVFVVLILIAVVAVVTWKRRRVKTDKKTQMSDTETRHKDNEKSETYCNIGNYVSEGKTVYSKANTNITQDNSSDVDYEKLGDTAQNDASIYSVINDIATEGRKKDKLGSSVEHAQQLLLLEKDMKAMEKKKSDLILKKKKLLEKLAKSESTEK